MEFSIEPEISGCSVVMVGDFNPAIFHPSWLKSEGIENDISKENIDLQVVCRDISSFRIDTRTYTVMPERFTLATSAAPWVSIKDIVEKIFGDCLVHTPIHAFGVNRNLHFAVESTEVRTKIGRQLAPIGIWREFGSEMETDDPSLVGGLQSLTMRRRKRHDSIILETNAKIEPSTRLSGDKGIYMEVNHHHALLDYDGSEGTGPAIDLLMNSFDRLVVEAGSIMNTIMEQH